MYIDIGFLQVVDLSYHFASSAIGCGIAPNKSPLVIGGASMGYHGFDQKTMPKNHEEFLDIQSYTIHFIKIYTGLDGIYLSIYIYIL